MLESLNLGDSASLAWAVGLGLVGSAYFIHGKRMHKTLTLSCGVGLMVVPYFVSGTVVLASVGALLCALPFLTRYL